MEIIVVDTESSDDSVIVAKEFGCKVVKIEQESFTYGRSLNIGMSKCSSEFVLSLSSHVVLLGIHFLQDLYDIVQGLPTEVAGIRFVSATDIKNYILGVTQASVLTPTEFLTSSKSDKIYHWRKLLVANCCLFRKSCWENQHFDEVIIANEDKKWSINQLERGFTIMYDVPLYYLYYKPSLDYIRFKRKNLIETITMLELLGVKAVNKFVCLSFIAPNVLPQNIVRHKKFNFIALSESVRPLLGGIKKVVVSCIWNFKVNSAIANLFRKNRQRLKG